MSEMPSNDVLLEKIANLSEKVGEGFKGVHNRQDEANHATAKNSKFRVQAQTSLSNFKWLFGTLGIGNIIMFIKVFI